MHPSVLSVRVSDSLTADSQTAEFSAHSVWLPLMVFVQDADWLLQFSAEEWLHLTGDLLVLSVPRFYFQQMDSVLFRISGVPEFWQLVSQAQNLSVAGPAGSL